jgi:hypothetical protein
VPSGFSLAVCTEGADLRPGWKGLRCTGPGHGSEANETLACGGAGPDSRNRRPENPLSVVSQNGDYGLKKYVMVSDP